MNDDLASWDRALAGLRILSACPDGLGGAVLRMRSGPARDNMLGMINMLFRKVTRIAPGIDDVHLLGGIDLTATLGSGKLVETQGLLDGPRVILLSMAERCPIDLAARLAAWLDKTPGAVLVALDEGASEDEYLPPKLAERLAFHFEPSVKFPNTYPRPAKLRTEDPDLSDEMLQLLTRTACEFGIDSLRAPQMATRAARVLAMLDGQDLVSEHHVSEAAALVFAHRATRVPSEPHPDDLQEQPPPEPAETAETPGDADQSMTLPSELVVSAVRAQLPPEVLAGLGRVGLSGTARGQGMGRRQKGNRRGRTLPSRRGSLNGRNRLDMLATLRAAAPFQKIRGAQAGKIRLHQDDFHVKRYETRSDRLVVFAVDASGSSAVARLNETKGAIEIMLGQAYAARDHVSLVTFRGQGAECLLPPTRSLVQTRKKLSSMPGGGGTPLAAGLEEAFKIAVLGRDKGMTPALVLMTDGKANIAMDGTANRDQAREDMHRVASVIRRSGLEMLILDTGRRPSSQLRDLAQNVDAGYLPLPRGDAKSLSRTVQSALDIN